MTIHFKDNLKNLRSLRGNLTRERTELERSFRRLSSGIQVNDLHEGDSLEIASSLKSRIRRFAAAERVTHRAILAAKSAAGGLGDIARVVERMRDLAGRSADEQLSLTVRGELEDEFQGLKAEIIRLSDYADLHDPRMMYAGGSIDFQIAPATMGSDRVQVDFDGVTLTLLGLQDTSLVEQQEGVLLDGSSLFDDALHQIDQRQEHAGSLVKRLRRAVVGARTISSNLEAASSGVAEVDYAENQSVLVRAQMLLRSGVSVLAQANQGSGVALHLLH